MASRFSADIDLGADGPPAIALDGSAPSGRLMFAAVVPPGGTEEDARLFAVETLGRPEANPPPFQEGSRPKPIRTVGYAVDVLDPQTVPRLYERGEHPGDFTMTGRPPDASGRAPVCVLAFFDLSDGFPHADQISTGGATRTALAYACDLLSEPRWHKAADLFDPAKLTRSGTIEPAGGNPMTAENFHRYMLDRSASSDRGMDATNRPMTDYRLLAPAGIFSELEADARGASYGNPDMLRGSVLHRLLHDDIPDLAAKLRQGADAGGEVDAVLAAARSIGQGPDDDTASGRMSSGVGPGAACWRNLTAAGGLLETISRRLAEPSCDDAAIAAVEALPDWLRRLVTDPEAVVLGRLRGSRHAAEHFADPGRRHLGIRPSRLAAGPALRTTVEGLWDDRLVDLLDGTEALAKALATIPNSHPMTAEAHDCAAVGWRVLATEAIARDLLDEHDCDRRAPPFKTEAAGRRPFLASMTGEAAARRRLPQFSR